VNAACRAFWTTDMTSDAHTPVMLTEVLDGLRLRVDGTYLDGTFGRGGHARAVLERLRAGGRLLLMDRDPAAVAVARREFASDARVASAMRHANMTSGELSRAQVMNAPTFA